MRPFSERSPGLAEVLYFHKNSIEQYGGSVGVRDEESILAAIIARPWQVSFGQEHFPSPFDKAAALAESIIRRHPFVDSNKRTAMYAAAYLLSTFGYEVEAEQEELEDFAVSVAEGKLETRAISLWFERHSRRT